MNTNNSTIPAHSHAESMHLKFRPDIEGLRAIAIFIVVACHAGIPGMQGGFIGVDVFFVLSGYLISGLLIKEINNSGKINFIDFYARRLKRLLPALLVMTIGTGLFAGFILAPMEQVTQAATIKWVPYWITNFIFSFSDLNYFSSEAQTNLFLHTWSLAVEEQFYLVWPLLILAIFKGSHSTSSFGFISNLLKYFGVIFILFLFLSIFLSYIKPLWGFYLMPSRAWQFGLGALTYIFINQNPATANDSGSISSSTQLPYFLCGWLGLLFILVGTVLLSETMVYPGFWALLPSFGAALIIYSGTLPVRNSLADILSTRAMQFFGKVSYSWYLWHWPVLVLGNILVNNTGLIYQLLLVFISLLLAIATTSLLEAPIRKQRFLVRRPGLTTVFSLVLMTGFFFLGNFWEKKSLSWAGSPEQLIYSQVKTDRPVIYEMGCDDWYFSSIVKPCSFGDFDSENTAVLLGDSVGVQWFSALALPLISQGWRFIVVTKSSCPLVDVPWFYPRIGEEYTVCSDWRNKAIEFLSELKPQIIFMGSAAEYGFSSSQWRIGTRSVLNHLSEDTGSIYIISSSYRLPFDGAYCLARKKWQPEFLASLSTCNANAGSPLDDALTDDLNVVANEFNNVGILDLNPLICPDKICSSKIGDTIVYRDYQHITTEFVDTITADIYRAIDGVRFNP